jgi:isoquinoline 1-oxidoreductase beta subunit
MTDEIEKHVMKRYEIVSKLGKGVRARAALARARRRAAARSVKRRPPSRPRARRQAYGIDYGVDPATKALLPGLQTVVVARPPVFGGKIAKFDATAARAVRACSSSMHCRTYRRICACCMPAVRRRAVRSGW